MEQPPIIGTREEAVFMELRVLRYFLAVAREESVTAAAARLHVTQPTLSKQLMDLEKELGKKLFTRGGRKITLTEEGLYLRNRAREIVELADKTEEEFRAGSESIAGDVSIGAGETDGMRFLVEVMKGLRETCPALRFHLYSGNSEDVTERLDKGLLDFGLFVGRVELKKYEYLRLPVSDTWGLFMRRDNPLARKNAVTPEDLRRIPLLCSSQALIQNELSSWLGYPFEELSVIGTYNLIFNASLMVESGMGAAVCIDKLVNVSAGSQLCFRPFKPRFEAELTLAWKKYQVFSAAARKFLNELQRRLESERGSGLA